MRLKSLRSSGSWTAGRRAPTILALSHGMTWTFSAAIRYAVSNESALKES